MLMRLLAVVFNAFPVRWQRRFMSAANDRFLVGVTGLGVDDQAACCSPPPLRRPAVAFLGGFLHPKERVEDALAREIWRRRSRDRGRTGPRVVTGHHWQRVEVVFA